MLCSATGATLASQWGWLRRYYASPGDRFGENSPALGDRTPGSSASPTRRKGGPERFFYDKSSYTGVHTKGGPTISGSGLSDSVLGPRGLPAARPVPGSAVVASFHASLQLLAAELHGGLL